MSRANRVQGENGNEEDGENGNGGDGGNGLTKRNGATEKRIYSFSVPLFLLLYPFSPYSPLPFSPYSLFPFPPC
jgi:hypothetical protein